MTVRVLVHDTRTSASLLNQLGVKSTLRWLDSAPDIDLPFGLQPLTVMSKSSLFTHVFSEDDSGRGEFSVIPTPDEELREYGEFVAFESWWSRDVLVNAATHITRKNVVDLLANTDGGAHVDLLAARYQEAVNALPVFRPALNSREVVPAFNQSGAARTVLRAMMRTIAGEVAASILDQIAIIDPAREVFAY